MSCQLLVGILSLTLIFQPLAPTLYAAGNADEIPASSTGDLTAVPDAPDGALEAETTSLHESLVKATRHSLDTFRLLEQSAINFTSAHRIQSNLTVEVLSAETGQPEQAIYASDFASNQNSSFVETRQGSRFRILYQDKPFLEFSTPIKAIGFYGPYLIFRDQKSFNAQTGVDQLSFLDLAAFRSVIGRTEIPVFRLPVKTGVENARIEIRNGTLQVGHLPVSQEVIGHFSEVQQMSFNVTVSLVDPKTFVETTQLISELGSLFDKATALAGEDVVRQADALLGSHEATLAHLKDMRREIVDRKDLIAEAKDKDKWSEESAGRYGLNLDSSAHFQETIQSIGKTELTQKKLLARVKALWFRLSFPQPDGAPKIREALAMVAQGLMKTSVDPGRDRREGLLQLINHPYIKWGAGTVAAATLGVMVPEVAQFAYGALDIGREITSTLLGKGADLWHLTAESASATLAGFSPYEISDTYIENGRLPKVLVGMSAAFCVLFVTLGIPHLLVNGIKLVKDLDKRAAQATQGGAIARAWNWTTHFRSYFISRQQQTQESYLKQLADGEAEEAAARNKNQPPAVFTPEQDALARKAIAELAEREKGWVQKLRETVRSWPIFKQSEAKSPKKMETFRGALMHFLFSSASFTLSGVTYAKMWNGWFAFRSFIWHPILWATFIYNPNYLGTAMKGNRGLQIPTELNGGLRPITSEAYLRVRSLLGDEQLKSLHAWEEKILPVEIEIRKVALRKSFHALLQLVKDKKTLQKLVSTGGITSLTDQTLYELSAGQRRFFFTYYQTVQDRAISAFLTKVVNGADLVAPSADLVDLKEATLGQIDSLHLSHHEAERLVHEVVKDPSLYEDVTKNLEGVEKSLARYRQALHYRNLRKLDPARNRQTDRIQTVNRQLDKPQAVARAVRATMAGIIVDKPMELLLLFACLAGVKEGISVPLHDEMFSENAWFYLGRFVFLTGYVTGVITGVLADIWMKIQMDEKNDDKFGEAPSDEEAKKGYFHWFRKHLNDKDNSIWSNQKHYIKIIWANMPAALAFMLVSNILTLGRLDLDNYVLGYLVSYVVPTSGFSAKIEQAFELASSYYKAAIPKEYRSHPAAQEYLNARVGRARIVFNLWFRLQENVIGYFQGTFETISTPLHGSRAFGRILFAGYTPTEWAAQGLDKIAETAQSIPGIPAAAEACKKLITHLYTDWKK